MSLSRSKAGGKPSLVSSFINRLLRFGALPIVLLFCIVIFELANPHFLSRTNLINVLQQSVFLMLISFGQMLVLISGGFDLSVGAVVALTSILSSTAMVMVSGWQPDQPFLAILAGFATALLTGLCAGLVNALGVSVLRVNAFIVTLATTSIFQGLTLVISQGMEVTDLPIQFVYGIGSDFVLGIPVSALFAVPALLIVYVLLHRMRFGRYVYAIGSNTKSALVAGVPINRYLMFCYAICSVITAFSGLLLTARVSSGEPLLGSEFPLDSIAAAVIGGCSLRGGEGGAIGVLLGVIFITVLANGMDLMQIGSNFQMIVLGIVLVGAVVLDRFRAGQNRK